MGALGVRTADRSAGVMGWTAAFVFAFAGLAAPAGGLGYAPLALVGGLVALVCLFGRPGFFAPVAAAPAFWCAAAFVGWSAITWTWSPYDNLDYVAKFVAGVAVYAAFTLGCAHVSPRGRRLAAAALVFAVVAAGFVLLAEYASGGALTSAGRHDTAGLRNLWRNLGHGASAMLMLAPAAIAVAWTVGGAARAAAVFVAVSVLVSGVAFGMSANAFAAAAAAAAGLVAVRAPRLAVRWTGYAAAATIALAPLIGVFAASVPAAARASMPLSWELRLEAWTFAAGRIADAPLFGGGFDASRTMHPMVELRGRAFDAMPLHPHNIGLQVWVETGLVGAALLSAAVVLAARAVARAPGLSTPQAAAAAASAGAYAAMGLVSYGAWQEWWVAAAFLAAAGCMTLSKSQTDDPTRTKKKKSAT